MKNKSLDNGGFFLMMALLMLVSAVVFGFIASLNYVLPGLFSPGRGLEMLRPFHVTSALFWILMGAAGAVYASLKIYRPEGRQLTGPGVQGMLWLIAIAGIFYSYSQGKFGGREYWEFDPVWSVPLTLAWILFAVNFFRMSGPLAGRPVYVWMWMTGIVFFLFIFAENHLWLLPSFRQSVIADLGIQWKVNGSVVGSWNQILYGTAFFLMDKLHPAAGVGRSKTAFAMYFLGLFNLMFNWGHHIYSLPVPAYVRYTGYAVSMTEWIFFARIIYTWRASVKQARRSFASFPYRYILAADFWVFLNMGQALMMSIPVLNLYTHGTHVTVAHAMGTTIGINSMILLSACFTFLRKPGYTEGKMLKAWFWILQGSLLIFWLSLNTAGVLKGLWQMGDRAVSHSVMMKGLMPYFATMSVSGFLLMVSLLIPALHLLYFRLSPFRDSGKNM